MRVGRSDDEAEEHRRRTEDAEQNALTLALLLDVETLWDVLLGDIRPVTTERQFDAVVARAAELVESTAVAGTVHPSERPLRPLLERCPHAFGGWRLDTEALTPTLQRANVELPPLPLPGDSDGAPDTLHLHVDLSQPRANGEAPDRLTVIARDADGEALFGKVLTVLAPLLAEGVRDHLTDALATATVLSHTSSEVDHRLFEEPAGDVDADAARTADRLVDLFAGLEHALARREAGGRDPGGDSPVDPEVESRRTKLFAMSGGITVDVRQNLPAGTLEPERLTVLACTDADPDGYGMQPIAYRLSVDLRDARRGEGILEVEGDVGNAQRAVLLPRMTLLWTDHIDSALRRAHVLVPAVRRSILEEMEHPVEEVEPPVGDEFARLLSGYSDVPF
jgi:hypothetical protein